MNGGNNKNIIKNKPKYQALDFVSTWHQVSGFLLDYLTLDNINLWTLQDQWRVTSRFCL
jgi:hypothetical protein